MSQSETKSRVHNSFCQGLAPGLSGPSPFAAAGLAHHQPYLAMNAEQPFAVHDEALAARKSRSRR